MDFLAKPVEPDHLLLMVERAIAQRRMLTEYFLLKEELAERRGAPRIIGEDPQAAAGVAAAASRGGDRRDGAARGRERHRQGAVRARAARAQPARRRAVRRDQLRGHSRDAARDRALRPREGRVHRAPRRASRAGSSWRTAARCSSTRSATCRWRCRRRSCARSRRSSSSASAARSRCTSTCASWPPRTATSRQRVAERQFREDLYFRLSVFPITIPPLRERAGDIADPGAPLRRPVLPRSEQEDADRCRRRRSTSCSAYPWPGNVRELQNCIERAVILCDGDTIQPRHLNLSRPRRPRRRGRRARGTQIDLSGTHARRDCGGSTAKSSAGRSFRPCSEANGDNGPSAAARLRDRLQGAAQQAQGIRNFRT